MGAKHKLAELLLRRKELNEKVDLLKQIKQQDLFEVKVQRKAVHEGVDDVIAAVPKLELSQVTAEYDYHARALRLVDAAIQQANWTTEVEVPGNVMDPYKAQ
ncbi:MAG: DIP1984 family protein [Planctomycetota bacterium]